MPENINIDKTVFNKKQLESVIDTKFSEFFTQTPPLTVDQFFEYYSELIFDIPDDGVNSHKELIRRSIEYLGEDIFEDERNQLLEQIADLETRVIELEAADPEHPVFTNGSLLRYDDFGDRPEGGIVFYMEKGIRRKLSPTTSLTRIIIRSQNPEARKLSNSQLDSGDYIQDIPSSIMDQIELGPDFTENDFTGKNIEQRESPTTKLLKNTLSRVNESLKTGKVKKLSRQQKGKKGKIMRKENMPKSKKFITK